MNTTIKKFINYYLEKVNIINESKQISEMRLQDFNSWVEASAQKILVMLGDNVAEDADGEKVVGLIKALKLLIDKNIDDKDYEGLIDNLYYAPEKLQSSFSKFNLISQSEINRNIELPTIHENKTAWDIKVDIEQETLTRVLLFY